MIENINLKKIATYDKVGVNLNNLKKVNFFFGYNGSGKSTLAKYLYNISLEEDKQNNMFNMCSYSGYDKNEYQILVFNEDFTKRNFIKNTSLKGVFSLNETNEEIDKKIREYEDFIKEYDKRKINKSNLIKVIKQNREETYNNLLDNCWNKRSEFNIFTKIKLDSGTKKSHFKKIGSYLDIVKNIPTLAELSDEYKTLYEKDLAQISTNIDVQLYIKVRKTEKRLNKLLLEVIVGNEDVDIARLIKKFNLKNWIDEGRKYLEKTDLTCPFCQKETIDDNFKKQLNEIFNETYKEKIDEIIKLKKEYKYLISELLQNILDIQNIFNPKNLVSNIYRGIEKNSKENINIIEYKIKNPNEKKELISIQNIKTKLSELIDNIKKNNKLFLKLDEHQRIFIKNIWIYMTDKCQQNIEIYEAKKIKYKKILELANCIIQKYYNKIIEIKESIEELRTQTINTKEAVDSINNLLQNSGFDGFEIEEQNIENNISQYYLKRFNDDSSEVFNTLSEGEKNFISFLYFYQLCTGTDDILQNGLKKKIIVIDDPVSSLDSRVLFIVSTLIRNLIQRKANSPKIEKKEFKNDNLSQVFIFTHNLYFYKEVAFDKRVICMDFVHFQITKIDNNSSILLVAKQIFDDYSLMWKSLKDIKNNLPDNKSMNIFIANTMRRIIESYVNFIGIGNNPWASLSNKDENKPSDNTKSAFISMINDESHKIGALDNIYYQRIINEESAILFDIFEEIFNNIGIKHYNLMFEIEEN